jgi:hypothetical protein
MLRILLSTAFAFAIGPANAAERLPPRLNDYVQFEFCYGNLEGSRTILPRLKDQFDPAVFEQVTKATDDFAEAFADIEMRLAGAVLHPDAADLNSAHRRGYQAWMQPQNQSLDYWSRNGPMPAACFDLFKKLNEILPLTLN